jgi:hypothetical protein
MKNAPGVMDPTSIANAGLLKNFEYRDKTRNSEASMA